MNPKVGILFLIIKNIITNFGFVSIVPVEPELHMCTCKCGECSIKSTCATHDVLSLLT
jgi:hypothetical protein